MGWEAWITLTVVAACVALLAHNRYAPDLVLMAGLTLLLLEKVRLRLLVRHEPVSHQRLQDQVPPPERTLWEAVRPQARR